MSSLSIPHDMNFSHKPLWPCLSSRRNMLGKRAWNSLQPDRQDGGGQTSHPSPPLPLGGQLQGTLYTLPEVPGGTEPPLPHLTTLPPPCFLTHPLPASFLSSLFQFAYLCLQKLLPRQTLCTLTLTQLLL